MAKRMTDTDKYKKRFVRGLPGAYKLLWDYLYHDCNHAGIWHVDFEIAQIYLGADMPVDSKTALELFNADEERVIVLDEGRKWFIPKFLEFQYGQMNPRNRVHLSVLKALMVFIENPAVKPLLSPFLGAIQGAKDKDKDKDKDKEQEKEEREREKEKLNKEKEREREKKIGGSGGKLRLFPIPGKSCCKCRMPAVYKAVGEFNHYYCGEHMPAQVKEKYDA